MYVSNHQPHLNGVCFNMFLDGGPIPRSPVPPELSSELVGRAGPLGRPERAVHCPAWEGLGALVGTWGCTLEIIYQYLSFIPAIEFFLRWKSNKDVGYLKKKKKYSWKNGGRRNMETNRHVKSQSTTILFGCASGSHKWRCLWKKLQNRRLWYAYTLNRWCMNRGLLTDENANAPYQSVYPTGSHTVLNCTIQCHTLGLGEILIHESEHAFICIHYNATTRIVRFYITHTHMYMYIYI